MELPETPCLWPLMAEHRSDVKIFLWERIGRPIVLDERANRPRSAFRAQGQRGPVSVGEGVHLLLATSLMKRHRGVSSGRMSLTPLMALMVSIFSDCLAGC